jgi:hypothetical protein
VAYAANANAVAAASAIDKAITGAADTSALGGGILFVGTGGYELQRNAAVQIIPCNASTFNFGDLSRRRKEWLISVQAALVS